MNVKKINKGLATALFLGLSLTALVGCAPTVTQAAPTDKPVATQTMGAVSTPLPRPTLPPAPKATPTPTISPSPITEAEYAEEKMKLGIIDENRLIETKNVDLLLLKDKNGEYKMAFVVVFKRTDLDKYSTFDLFSGELLYRNDSDKYLEIFNEGSTESVVPMNESLADYQFLRITTPMGQIFDFPAFGLELPLSKELYYLFSDNREKSFSKSDYVDIYFKYIPKEYRFYGAELIPGDPQERMIVYPGPTVSPSPEATQQQSSRNYNPLKEGYKTTGYYNQRNTGIKNTVISINPSNVKHGKTL